MGADSLSNRKGGASVPILGIFDFIGVFVFALSGALVAIQRKMDVFGIYVLATVTACGGGVIRDVVMDNGIPAIFSSYTTIALIVAAATLAIFLCAATLSIKLFRRTHWQLLMNACDAIGLAVFVVDAGVKSIRQGYNMPQFLFVSIITGVGGGVLRDLFCQRIPIILRKEVYASAGIAGALFLWFSYPYLGMNFAAYGAIAVVFLTRMVSLKYNMNLPRVEDRSLNSLP